MWLRHNPQAFYKLYDSNLKKVLFSRDVTFSESKELKTGNVFLKSFKFQGNLIQTAILFLHVQSLRSQSLRPEEDTMGTVPDSDSSEVHELKSQEEEQHFPRRSGRVCRTPGEWWNSQSAVVMEFPDSLWTCSQGTKGRKVVYGPKQYIQKWTHLRKAANGLQYHTNRPVHHDFYMNIQIEKCGQWQRLENQNI